ncbi:hypothetical protein TeGR_g41, partial [Tetraparma gracilis]
IGDENGRIVRVKDPGTLLKCSACQLALKVTKTNTELKAHATKEGKALEDCFPGAEAASIALAAAAPGKQQVARGMASAAPAGKKKPKEDLNDLFASGLDLDKSKKKKGKT